jgi:DMSO/TMAO reductase YedYZ molybdopterin-dependent catalytic subunit
MRERVGIALVLITVLAAACASHPPATVAPTRATTSAALASATPVSEATSAPPVTEMPTLPSCDLEPVVAPTPPAEPVGYAQLDRDTGLHVTGTAQQIALESYRLEVSGKVDRPLSLTYDDLRCLPKVETRAILECPGFFVDEATWAGAPMREVLALAGVQQGATALELVSADGYSRSVPISEGLSETAFLAYEWEGEPLPVLHGFPVRVVLPGVSGGSWIKWLVEIRVN